VSVLAASLFAADTGGPAALCASAVFMALPPSTKIELLAALPQACPLHHEQLRVLLSHVLSLLQAALHPPRPPPCTPSTVHTLLALHTCTPCTPCSLPPHHPPPTTHPHHPPLPSTLRAPTRGRAGAAPTAHACRRAHIPTRLSTRLTMTLLTMTLLTRHKRCPTRLSRSAWPNACGRGSLSASTCPTSPTARCVCVHARCRCRCRMQMQIQMQMQMQMWMWL
jgi:hypothetical protein